MSRIKAAIFDLDGTIADSMYVWDKVDDEFLTRRGIPVTQEYKDDIKTMFFESAARYTIDKYKLDESVEQVVRIWLDMAHKEYKFNVRIKPDVERCLKAFKDDGLKIGIATSSSPCLTESVLKNNNIDRYFDEICYTSQVGKGKEFPDIYLYTAKKLGVKPFECVVFEDITVGISSAKAAGMKTVAVYDKASENDIDTLKNTADRYIFDFSEISGAELWKETD